MIKLTEVDKILKNTYLYLAGRSSGKTHKRINERVVCMKCGRADKTLLAIEKINGFERARLKLEIGKICTDCVKELKGEV